MTSKWSTALSTLAFVLFGSSAARAEWVAKESPTGNALVQVQCLTTTSCWIAGVGGVVLHSSDGGEQWEEVDSGAPANYGAWNGLSFVDENTGWFSGLRIISRTPDSGETWKGATMGPGPFDDPPFQNALWAISSQLAWSVGADLYDVGGGSVLGVPSFWIHGVDGDGEFQNYTQRVIPTLTGIFYDIEFVGTQDAWAVGYSDQPVKTGIVYRVQNASAEDPLITPQAFAQDLSLEGISMIDTQQGWIVGEAGLILRTNNGGVAWSSQPSGVTDDLWDVHFVDSANGWAVGEAGIIMSTKNGGSSWQNTTWSATAHLTSVHFLSADFGFAVGSSGTILKWEEPTCDDTEECGGGPGGGAGSGGAQAPGVGGEGGRAGEGGASAEAGMGGDGSREPGGAGESSSAGDGAGPGPSTGGTANDGGVSAGANAAVDPSDRVSRQSEGCGCRTTSGSSPKSAAVLALLAGLALLRRRGSGRLV
jgi:MYXO-CTERM domain-containing protein